MKPILQTKFGPNDGNCEAAAVASILEEQLIAVPQIKTGEPEHRYFRRLSRWLRRNYGVYYLHCRTGAEHGKEVWRPQGWSVGGIASAYDGLQHAIVCFDGVGVHDPLGDPRNLQKPILGHSVFVVYDLEIMFTKPPKRATGTGWSNCGGKLPENSGCSHCDEGTKPETQG